MIKASGIRDEESLREWLEGQSVDVARVIVSRAALRIFPFALSIHQENHQKLTSVIKFDLTLQVFRASFISWVARKYPTHDITAARAAARAYAAAAAAVADADADAADAAYAAARAAARAAFAADADAADAAYAAAADAAFAAFAAFAAADAADAARAYAAAAAAAYAAARADAEWLENNPDDINALINQPLWLEPSNAPEAYRKLQNTIRDNFYEFRQSDLAQDTSFGLICDWYAALLPEKGKPRSLFGEKKDLELATQPEEFWEGEAQEVMDRVAKLVGWPEDKRPQMTMKELILSILQSENRGFSISEIEEIFAKENFASERHSIRGRLNELTESGEIARIDRGVYASNEFSALLQETKIPPSNAAAILPEWRDDKLSLPLEPIENDFSAGDMDQALSALKKDLHEFASDIDKSNNIDPRIVEYISKLAEEAPETVPTQEEFFRFAHKEEVLRGLVDHAAQEWDAMLAARFGGLTLSFSQTVQKFPPWREFIKVEYSEIQTHEDLEKVKELEAMLAENLQEELAEEFVDPQLPEALSALANDIPEINSVTADDRALPVYLQRQGHDVLESISNILKELFRVILSNAKKLGVYTAEIIKDEIPKAYEKAVRYAIRGGIMTIVYAALKMSGAFGAIFNWLQSLLPLLELILKAIAS